MKPTFLLYNIGICFLGLATRLQEEGYEVYSYYDKDTLEGGKIPGKNMIECCSDPFKIMHEFKDNPKKLIILVDDNGEGCKWELIKKLGFPVVGVGSFNDIAEHDREMGNKIAGKVGLSRPKRTKFTDFEAAYNFLDSQDPETKYVVKFDGFDLGGGSFTYLAKDTEDMKTYLAWAKGCCEAKNVKADSFTLQEIIDGTEVDYEMWYDGSKFLDFVGVTFEEKKQHDLGAAEGCLGQVYFLVDPKESKYKTDFMDKLEPIISQNKVAPGSWAINNIVGEDGKPYYLEFTPRHGWDATISLWSLLVDAGHSLGDFYERLAYGTSFPDGYFPFDRVSCAVRIYSMGIGRANCDVAGRPLFFNESLKDNFYFYNISCDEQGQYVVTGNPVGVAVAVADSIEEARAKVYELVNPENKNILTPDMVYSESVGERATGDARKIKNMGWL